MPRCDTSPPASGPIDPAALFGLLSVVLICSMRRVLDDGDTYTHIAAGSWMIEHGAVLRSDPFSATFAGHAWMAHEWLSEILFGLAYRVDGLAGIILLTAAPTGIAFANLARHVGRWSGWAGTMALTAGALACVMPNILARPHILALPVLELWVAELLSARRGHRMPSAWLLPLMVVWANLHGGFAFGLAIAAALALEATIQAGWRDRTVWLWWGFLGGAIGAAVLTPQGWDGLIFPFHLLQFQSLSYIKEWAPIDLTSGFGVAGALVGLIVLLGTGRVRVPGIQALILVALVYLTLAHTRHSLLLGVAGALILAEPVGRAFVGSRVAVSRPVGRGLVWSGVAVVVLLRLSYPVEVVDSKATPVSAVAQLPARTASTPVLNTSGFGGYLALIGLHPFIDGRAELFGDAFVSDFLAMAQADGEKLRDGIKRYGIGWALLAVDDPLVAVFDRMAGWRRQYGDASTVVFVPDGGDGRRRDARAGISIDRGLNAVGASAGVACDRSPLTSHCGERGRG